MESNMDWIIRMFDTIPNGFWLFLNSALVPLFLWIFNRMKRKKEKNLSDIIKEIKTDVSQIKKDNNILAEQHKHRPFFIQLQVNLEDRLQFKTRLCPNSYLADKLQAGLNSLLGFYSIVLESDFTVVNKERTYNKIKLIALSVKDSFKISKLNIEESKQNEFIEELEDKFKSIIETFSIDLENIAKNKENGKRRAAFEEITIKFLDNIVDTALLTYKHYQQ